MRGEEPQYHGASRLRDVHKRRSILAANDSILPSRAWIGPAPYVVAVSVAAQVSQRHERQEVHIAALVLVSLPVGAGGGAHRWHHRGTAVLMHTDGVVLQLQVHHKRHAGKSIYRGIIWRSRVSYRGALGSLSPPLPPRIQRMS